MATDKVQIIIEGTDRTGGAFGSAAGGLQKIGKAALAVGATALAGLAAAAVAGGAAAVSLGADANETASLLQNSLGPATDMLNSQLQEFATAANRSFFELQAGASTFVAMTKAMGATEIEAANISSQFVQMATDLGSFFNVSTDQALQDLQGALAGSSETMQKYGVDVRETTLKQMALNQGLIESASEVLPRWMRAQLLAQAVQEQAADAMGDAILTSDSWQNSLRGLQARLSDTATSIGQQLIPVLAPLLEHFLDFADSILPPLLEKITGVADAFFIFGQNMQAGAPLVTNLGGLLAQLGINFGLSVEQANALKASFLELVAGAQALWGQISTLLAPITEAISGFVSWKDVAIALAIAVAAVIIPAIASLVAAIAPVIAIFAVVTAAVALVRNAWENNWGDIQGITKKVMATIQSIISTVTGAIQAIWAQHGDAISAKASAIWEAIQGLVSAVMGAIQSVISSVGGAIQGFWSSHTSELQAIASAAWEAIQTFISGATDNILTVVQAFTALFQGDWEGFLSGVLEAWTTSFETVVSILGTLWDGISPLLESLWTSIQGWFDGIDWASLGQAIVDGVKAGVDAGAQAIADAVKAAAQAALDAAKDLLGISSPSKAFAEVGASMIQGIQKGIADSTAALFKDLDHVIGGLEGKFATSAPFNLHDALNQAGGLARSTTMPGGGTVLGGAYAQWWALTHGAVPQQPQQQGNTYNLTINTSAPAENVADDFALMASMGS